MTDKLNPAEMMPGSFGLPFIGHTIGILAKQELFYWQQYQQYGNIFKISLPEAIGFGKCACLIEPEANQLVLKDEADKLSSRLGNRSLEPIVSKDLVLLQDGAAHRASRKLILPMFHHQALALAFAKRLPSQKPLVRVASRWRSLSFAKRLEEKRREEKPLQGRIASYFDTIQAVVTETVANWGKQGTISLETEMRKLTLAIAVRTFLGSNKTEEIERVSQWYVTLVNSLNGMVKWDSPLTFYGRGQSARRKIAEYIRQIIQDRIEIGDLERSKDVIGFLMSIVDEDGTKFTKAQIINQAIEFLFAAHETTSSLMSWLMFELGNHPEWRQNLRAELQQVAGNEPLKLQHLRQLPQLSNVLKEGERLYPPVGMSRAGTSP